MCGIAGIYGSDDISIARAMNAALSHRGPDDEGVFVDAAGGVALAHRRLSIIDVSACGHQPMSYDRGRYTVVFNGEIYNYRELRNELVGRGRGFSSHSDTEVLLAAYAEWGQACVRRLRGMFAFAIYDREARSAADVAVFLARDRFGIKPLYLARRGATWLFASEIKALLASGLIERRADLESLWSYLSLGSVPQPRTAIADVEMLRPGHTLAIHRDGSAQSARYWDLAADADNWRSEARTLDRHTAPVRLRELLDEATRLHMISDVPVGAFLSGGIDSAAVVGLMHRASGQSIRTFSVGFAGESGVADEREGARAAAKRFGCEHTEVVIDGRTIAEQFDDLVHAIDQPSLDGTNSFLVSKAASRDLKVALSGLGGDELFAGYPHFRRLRRAARAQRLFGRSLQLVRHLPGRFVADRDFLAAHPHERCAELRNLADDRSKMRMVSPDFARRVANEPLSSLYAPLLSPALTPIAQTTYIEANRYLVDTLLRDVDAMSMAWSLEVRPVLLDHRVAEFAFALPDRLKLAASNKPLLVDAVRDLLPAEILLRPKTGFELPLQAWLAGPLRGRAIESLASPTARQIFSPAFLSPTTATLDAGERPPLNVWSYVMLIEWLRHWRIDL